MLKNTFFIIFAVFAVFEISAKEPWPSGIDDPLIVTYISSRKDMTMNELKYEYNYILDFLEGAIGACEYNITNHINKVLTKKTSVLEKGELKIIEKESVRKVWSVKNNAFYYENEVVVPFELHNIVKYVSMHEEIIDYWKEITGKTSREHFDDNKNNLDQFLRLLEMLQENK